MADYGAFSCDFDSAFDTACEGVTAEVPLYDLAKRPEHPPHSPLWRRFQYPVTPAAILLWQDGRVMVVSNLHVPEFLTADEVILGGHRWVVDADSWQAQVLSDAGITLIPEEF